MNPALWVAKTGLDAQQTRLNVISNNLANVSTHGFKRDRAIFEDLLYQNVRQPGSQTSQDTILPSGLLLGTGVRTVATQKIHSQGQPVSTDNALDVMIQGRGFFQVLMPSGEVGYSRDGAFHLDAQGQLVTSNGYLVQPAITVPENALSVDIGTDGTITAKLPGQPQGNQIGNLQLVDFINPSGLQAVGENLFIETVASGAPQAGNPGLEGLGTILQGTVEGSNVNAVEELVSMLETQRAYEMNSKAISTADQMLGYVNQNL
ncbi:MAG: flagellar basal-body rod protein FlgG [Gammaproteobacteria bacterium]|nr:flagellar basal-body rod protein FlgG [Gammaproteobacteria bacterium]